jgi:hypothetical protein
MIEAAAETGGFRTTVAVRRGIIVAMSREPTASVVITVK